MKSCKESKTICVFGKRSSPPFCCPLKKPLGACAPYPNPALVENTNLYLKCYFNFCHPLVVFAAFRTSWQDVGHIFCRIVYAHLDDKNKQTGKNVSLY